MSPPSLQHPTLLTNLLRRRNRFGHSKPNNAALLRAFRHGPYVIFRNDSVAPILFFDSLLNYLTTVQLDIKLCMLNTTANNNISYHEHSFKLGRLLSGSPTSSRCDPSTPLLELVALRPRPRERLLLPQPSRRGNQTIVQLQIETLLHSSLMEGTTEFPSSYAGSMHERHCNHDILLLPYRYLFWMSHWFACCVRFNLVVVDTWLSLSLAVAHEV